MPQFDKINFFNQIFWLFIIILIFYFIIFKNYFFFFTTLLKTRKKITNFGKKLVILLVKSQKITYLTSNILALHNNFEFLLILEQNINCCFFDIFFDKKIYQK
jgi:Plant ATP synthase F0